MSPVIINAKYRENKNIWTLRTFFRCLKIFFRISGPSKILISWASTWSKNYINNIWPLAAILYKKYIHLKTASFFYIDFWSKFRFHCFTKSSISSFDFGTFRSSNLGADPWSSNFRDRRSVVQFWGPTFARPILGTDLGSSNFGDRPSVVQF